MLLGTNQNRVDGRKGQRKNKAMKWAEGESRVRRPRESSRAPALPEARLSCCSWPCETLDILVINSSSCLSSSHWISVTCNQNVPPDTLAPQRVRTSSINVTWELARNAGFQASPRPIQLNLHFIITYIFPIGKMW